MSLLVAVKTFSDLCLYAAVAATLARWAEAAPLVLLWPILLAALAVGLGGLAEKRRRLRPAALAALLPALLLVKSGLDLLLLAPVLLYAAAVIRRGRYDLDHGHYHDFFLRGLMGWGLFLLFTLVGMDGRPALFYGALFLLTGFFLLRQLRLGESGGWQDKALNLTALLSAIAGGGLLCLAVWGTLRMAGILGRLLWVPLRWLLELLLWLYQALGALGDWLVRVIPAVSFTFGEQEHIPDLHLPPYHFAPGSAQAPEAAGPLWLSILVTALFLVGVFFLARRMLRILGKRRAGAARPVRVERMAPAARTRRSPAGSQREKVRLCYRKFLLLLGKRGARLRPSHTSADVHMAALPVADPEAAAALRRLYLAARYDEGAEITAREAAEAKELLRALQREKQS